MKKFLVLALFIIVFLNSCTVTQNGEDLSGFTQRINILNEQYNLTSQGFIYSDKNDSIFKFFVVNENEILLSFKEDDKGRLIEMNFVANSNFYEDLSSLDFLKNSLNAFINNEKTYKEIIDNNNLVEALKTVTKETITIKSGNIEVLLDVTTLGTVITVHKDI